MRNFVDLQYVLSGPKYTQQSYETTTSAKSTEEDDAKKSSQD